MPEPLAVHAHLSVDLRRQSDVRGFHVRLCSCADPALQDFFYPCHEVDLRMGLGDGEYCLKCDRKQLLTQKWDHRSVTAKEDFHVGLASENRPQMDLKQDVKSLVM